MILLFTDAWSATSDTGFDCSVWGSVSCWLQPSAPRNIKKKCPITEVFLMGSVLYLLCVVLAVHISCNDLKWETFWDDRGQQNYRVNPLFSELCACSELRKQWKYTRYVCCHLALESLLFQTQVKTFLQSILFCMFQHTSFSLERA